MVIMQNVHSWRGTLRHTWTFFPFVRLNFVSKLDEKRRVAVQCCLLFYNVMPNQVCSYLTGKVSIC